MNHYCFCQEISPAVQGRLRFRDNKKYYDFLDNKALLLVYCRCNVSKPFELVLLLLHIYPRIRALGVV